MSQPRNTLLIEGYDDQPVAPRGGRLPGPVGLAIIAAAVLAVIGLGFVLLSPVLLGP